MYALLGRNPKFATSRQSATIASRGWWLLRPCALGLPPLAAQVVTIEEQIVLWHKQSEDSRRLAEVSCLGPSTETALVASIGDIKNFNSGRQVALWLGLVLRQYSSGEKQNLLGISKRGDSCLRTLLIHCARVVIYHGERKLKLDQTSRWITELVQRRN